MHNNAIPAPAPKCSKWGKESFRGHIASDTLGKSLATAAQGANFLVGQAPLAPLTSALHTMELKFSGTKHLGEIQTDPKDGVNAGGVD